MKNVNNKLKGTVRLYFLNDNHCVTLDNFTISGNLFSWSGE